VKFGRLIVGGILGGDDAQLLGGVPKNVVWQGSVRCVSHMPLLYAFTPGPLGSWQCPF
jgi:hypothetical protein